MASEAPDREADDDGVDASDLDDGGVDASDPDEEELRSELRRLREDLDVFEEEIEARTVHRSEIETDLKAYVRERMRRGHARGWGPYLVLLYGTAMTLGAFLFLSGGLAILAMFVVWLSTLGLYVLMVLVGIGIEALSIPARLVEAVRNRRS